jgi:hypothetical protein
MRVVANNPLPKGICSVCTKKVAIRNNGRLREHVARDGGRDSPACPGSGSQPAEEFQRQGTLL